MCAFDDYIAIVQRDMWHLAIFSFERGTQGLNNYYRPHKIQHVCTDVRADKIHVTILICRNTGNMPIFSNLLIEKLGHQYEIKIYKKYISYKFMLYCNIDTYSTFILNLRHLYNLITYVYIEYLNCYTHARTCICTWNYWGLQY